MDYALGNSAFDYKWPEDRAVSITDLPLCIPFNLLHVAIDGTSEFVSSLATDYTLLGHAHLTSCS